MRIERSTSTQTNAMLRLRTSMNMVLQRIRLGVQRCTMTRGIATCVTSAKRTTIPRYMHSGTQATLAVAKARQALCLCRHSLPRRRMRGTTTMRIAMRSGLHTRMPGRWGSHCVRRCAATMRRLQAVLCLARCVTCLFSAPHPTAPYRLGLARLCMAAVRMLVHVRRNYRVSPLMDLSRRFRRKVRAIRQAPATMALCGIGLTRMA